MRCLIDEINEFFSKNGYEMKESFSGYFYCVKMNEDGTTDIVWSDSACEDAYDLENATIVAYENIMDMVEIVSNE